MGSVALEIFARERSLGDCRFRSVASERPLGLGDPSLEDSSLGAFVWGELLGIFCYGTLSWDPRLVTFGFRGWANRLTEIARARCRCVPGL